MLHGRFDFALKAATGPELLRAHALLARTEELLAQIIVVPFNEPAAVHFDRLRQIKGLGKIGRADLLIASIALSWRATLVTRNVRHSRSIPQLRVVNWLADCRRTPFRSRGILTSPLEDAVRNRGYGDFSDKLLD